MPRIELLLEKPMSEGTPTIDVCRNCAADFHEGEKAAGAIVGSTDVDHPPYEDDAYTCACCNQSLTKEDN